MKKIISLIFIAVSCFFINIAMTNAQSLDCTEYLQKGDTGSSVKTLQQMLNKTTSCSLDEDGIYGSLTKKCVNTFQKKYNLSVDGIVGPKTCTKLNGLLNKGTTKTSTSSNNSVSSNSSSNYAYVMGDVINVRKAPSTSSDAVAQVKVGKKVKILETTGEWSHVLIGSGVGGYIKSNLLTKDIIVVDISEQTLVFYKSNKTVLKTNVVTGTKGVHDTPTGRYTLKVANLQRDRTLRGKNDDGSDYASYVEYWMPFITERGIGFHDASWRSSSEFTSSRYTYNGSHGCVNLKTKAAKRLYNNITSDTVVIIKK